MPKEINFRIGERDFEVFTALDRCPLTANQLRRLSATFKTPFKNEHLLRRRLRKLISVGLVKKFSYAIASAGRTPSYYKLTQLGFCSLYGAGAKLPRARSFNAISTGHHHHTYNLAEAIVHLCVTAKENNCEIIHFAKENSVTLVAEPFTLYPDSAFVVRRSDGKTFPFVLEIDNGSERVRSKQDVESLERKIRGYDAHQTNFKSVDPDRYVVLFITTRSELRLQNILDVAADLMTNSQRKVFVGCELQSFLSVDPFRSPAFKDHRQLRSCLVPSHNTGQKRTAKNSTGFMYTQFQPVLS